MADKTSDLIVIGAGLAGISAATAAVRQGLAVTLISAHDRHPPDFRGEKLGTEQMAAFDRMGLGDAARAQMTAFDGCWTYRRGRLVGRNTIREYSSDYSGLVNALAAALPREVERITGRIASIETSAVTQTVTLNDGRTFTGRILAVATGLGDAIRRMLGIERVVTSPAHSLSIGYDIEEPASDFAFPSIVWGTEPGDHRLSYLTLFPIGERLRGNLFVYRGAADDWTQTMRRDPRHALRRAMPALGARLGTMTPTSEIVVRPIDLVETRNHRRDGVVLLGDAFSVVCPITGMGMAKAINDADRFANHHLPAWLATPDAAAAKLGQYYTDPAKTALDATAMADSLAGRQWAVGDSLYWRTRRLASLSLSALRDSIFVDTGPLPAPDVDAPRLAATRRIG